MTKTQEAPTTHCIRCGRVLRSAQSIARGAGRTCTAKIKAAAIETVKARYAHKLHLVAKAEEAIEAGGVTLLRGKVCLVTGSQGATYKAHRSGCSCAAGARGKHMCHHRIAADIYLTSVTPVTETIGRQVIALATPAQPALQLAA